LTSSITKKSESPLRTCNSLGQEKLPSLIGLWRGNVSLRQRFILAFLGRGSSLGHILIVVDQIVDASMPDELQIEVGLIA
jgi:hypothetical protein